MTRTRALSRLGVIALFASVAACGDDTTTGPAPEEFAAEASLSDFQAMNDVLTSEAWEDFREAAYLFGPVGSATETLDVLNTLSQGHPGHGNRTMTTAMQDLAVSQAASFNPESRGTTFEWLESDGEGFYAATEREGAPADGIRFILYERDEEGMPIVANEIGHVDLIDEGDDFDGLRVRLSAVRNGEAFMDYRWEVAEGEEGFFIRMGGYLRAGEDRLEFRMELSDDREENVERLSYSARIDNRRFAIAMDWMEDYGEDVESISLFVTHGRNSLFLESSVDRSMESTTISGAVALNGEPFATFSGEPGSVTFMSARGDTLTEDEIQVLSRLRGLADEVWDRFEDRFEVSWRLMSLAGDR